MYHKKKLEILKKSLVESHHNNAFLMGIVSSALATIGLATNSQTTLFNQTQQTFKVLSRRKKPILLGLKKQKGVKRLFKLLDWDVNI